MNDVIKKIEKDEIGKYIENISLSKYTTYKVGGIAKLVVFPKNIDKLILLLKYLKHKKIIYKILGNGSNTLFSDNIFNGVIIKLDCFDYLEIIGTKVKVGAGYSLMKLSSVVARRSLAGLEFASGIPGTVGGAIYMNAGAYKSDMGYIVSSIKVLTPDFEVITMTNRELDFHYRTSFLQKHKNYICLEATIKLQKGNKELIDQINKERKKRRLETQPLEYSSAGSVFRNPNGMFAGQMIEQLGLKGLCKGGAQISEKHANFIINRENASAKDIKDLIDFTKDAIKDNYNVDLKVEQEFVNWE